MCCCWRLHREWRARKTATGRGRKKVSPLLCSSYKFSKIFYEKFNFLPCVYKAKRPLFVWITCYSRFGFVAVLAWSCCVASLLVSPPSGSSLLGDPVAVHGSTHCGFCRSPNCLGDLAAWSPPRDFRILSGAAPGGQLPLCGLRLGVDQGLKGAHFCKLFSSLGAFLVIALQKMIVFSAFGEKKA